MQVEATRDKNRILFEAWCKSSGHDYCFDLNSTMEYMHADCYGAFDAWEAARKLAFQEVMDLFILPLARGELSNEQVQELLNKAWCHE